MKLHVFVFDKEGLSGYYSMDVDQEQIDHQREIAKDCPDTMRFWLADDGAWYLLYLHILSAEIEEFLESEKES